VSLVKWYGEAAGYSHQTVFAGYWGWAMLRSDSRGIRYVGEIGASEAGGREGAMLSRQSLRRHKDLEPATSSKGKGRAARVKRDRESSTLQALCRRGSRAAAAD
jgi:hypothetical protein